MSEWQSVAELNTNRTKYNNKKDTIMFLRCKIHVRYCVLWLAFLYLMLSVAIKVLGWPKTS